MYPKPYSDNEEVRVFSNSTNPEDLIWHVDLEDREITVLSGDWLFQFDNELPFKLIPGLKFLISKDQWHRVIKGSTDLKIMIIKK